MHGHKTITHALGRVAAWQAAVAASALACLLLLSATLFASAQPAASVYDSKKPDLRGRWAGMIVGTADAHGEASDGGIETFRFEAEIKDSPGGWIMTLSRAPYDPGAGGKPVSASFPIAYDANGWIAFTASLPNRNGKLVTVQFKGQANSNSTARHMIGRGFAGSFTQPSSAYAERMIAGRITDAPGIAPIVKGVSASELARWPVTLGQHVIDGNHCGYNSNNTPAALVAVNGTAAVYSVSGRQFTNVLCILHDIPGSQPIFTLDTPAYGSAGLLPSDTARLDATLQAAWNSEWGDGRAIATNLAIQHFVKNQHVFSLYDRKPEESMFRTAGGKATPLVSFDDMRATGKPMNSADSIIGARAIAGNRVSGIATAQAAEKPDLDAAIAAQKAALETRKQVALATRPALAKKHGYINHDDAYWAGIDYRPQDGESPGADLRLVFDGNSGAESGSPLANVYLADYVQVVGERCGKARNWPVIPITTVRTISTVNGYGTIVSQSTNSTTINYYVDPILYDEFRAAIDPQKAGPYAKLRAFQLTLAMLRGEPNAIDHTAQAHSRALKELSWMVAKEGCDSPTMKQLALNIKLMSLDRPSIQAAATGKQGSRAGGAIYTENGFTFIGHRRIAKETMALAPIVAGGKTYTWQDIVKLSASKIERNKSAGRAWWHPVLFRDDAGATYLVMDNSDPESEGDEIVRTYVMKISKADIDAWRAVRAKYDMNKRSDVIRAEVELMKLKVVRLMTYAVGGVRVTGDQDYPAWFDAAKTTTPGTPRPQTLAEWIADPLH